MLVSLFTNNGAESFNIYLAHSSITDSQIADLDNYISGYGHRLFAIKVGDELFNSSPSTLYYTKEMYYRLLAYNFLPPDIDRILYLDPDILVLNPIRKFYDSSFGRYMFIAAYRDNIPTVEVSRLRLLPYKISAYYNSGVILMNLPLCRKYIKEKVMFDFIEKNKVRLILPDQDLMNALYSKKIKSVDEKIYNYDTRLFSYYKLMSNGEIDINYIIYNTVFLHFCGPKKPWKSNYSGRFHALYMHYEKLAN